MATPATAGDEDVSTTGATRTGPRLVAVDFFRGVALTLVLLNHFDWSAGRIVFRRWTPVGLGFSDGAEAFVFLSGLTFGWVYSNRLLRDGFRAGMRKVLARVLQLYLGYVVCLLIVTAFSFVPVEMTEWSRNPLRIAPGESVAEGLAPMLRMAQFPAALGILGLYMVILPGMLLILALAQRARWLALSISAGLWIAVQAPLGLAISHPTWLEGWAFHPLAWQLMFVIGMLIGEHAKRTQAPLLRHRGVAALAAIVVLYGLASAKHQHLVSITALIHADLLHWLQISRGWLTLKSNLGPLRVLHFGAVAYLLAYSLPACSRVWKKWWAQPLIQTGRHSLVLYCCGTLMIYAAAVPLQQLGNSPAVIVTIGVAACLLQFVLAAWLEHRSSHRTVAARLPERPTAVVSAPSGAV